MLTDWITEHSIKPSVAAGLDRATRMLIALEQGRSPNLLRQAFHTAFHRIELGDRCLRLHLDRGAIVSWLTDDAQKDEGGSGPIAGKQTKASRCGKTPSGRQPADLSVRHLARAIDLPIAWNDQAELLSL